MSSGKDESGRSCQDRPERRTEAGRASWGDQELGQAVGPNQTREALSGPSERGCHQKQEQENKKKNRQAAP